MALARILVDGYSLLHSWPELAPGKPRHSAKARGELLYRLTRYQDAAGTPITVVFDGTSGPLVPAENASPSSVEVLYSKAGQTADQMIERAAHRLTAYGEVLVVTDDYAERDTITSMGGMASSCAYFIQSVEAALAESQEHLKHHNSRERNKFKRPRHE